MSMSVVLSDQAASIVQAHMADYGSAEEIIEMALTNFHEDSQDDPEYMEYLRLSLAECGQGPMVELDFSAFTRSLHAAWEKEQRCHA